MSSYSCCVSHNIFEDVRSFLGARLIAQSISCMHELQQWQHHFQSGLASYNGDKGAHVAGGNVFMIIPSHIHFHLLLARPIQVRGLQSATYAYNLKSGLAKLKLCKKQSGNYRKKATCRTCTLGKFYKYLNSKGKGLIEIKINNYKLNYKLKVRKDMITTKQSQFSHS